jgi:predicted DNA-binding transcriptional regulator YafY
MGFPLVTVGADEGQPDDVGYRIPRELYELPDPGLDESELAALRLAASAVQLEGEWGRDAVIRALRKLGGAVGDGSDGSALDASNAGRDGLAALPGEEAAAIAFAAVAERRQLTFSYRGEEREVDPWRLSFHRGHWYLAGLDHTRGEERLFRLDRVAGEVAASGPAGAFARPSGSQSAPPRPWRLGDDEEVLAHLRVDAEQAHWARQDLGEEVVSGVGADGSVEFQLPVTNTDAVRSFVLGYLDHAEILGPPDLRASMVDWLKTIATSRGEP